MDKLIIEGGFRLQGKVETAGAKNAALPLMAACLASSEQVFLTNVPNLSDITTMANLLVYMGVDLTIDGNFDKVKFRGRRLRLNATKVESLIAPYDIVSKMRASVIVLGPLLARFGEATISLPGGCAIGARPINFHLDAFEKMGAKIELAEGYIKASTHHLPNKRLQGAVVDFPVVSVGATENVLIAATLADGTTVMNNSACEPEITDLAIMLNKMGAKITGLGTSTLTIEGVETLGGCEHEVVSDRIEAGTYACVAAVTGGEVEITNIDTANMESTLVVLDKMGVNMQFTAKTLYVNSSGFINPVNVSTQPHPGFPTDMQAQIVTLMCLASGHSTMTENIFENRFMHAPELTRMGAKLNIKGNMLEVDGIPQFKPATVMATDLRASVSLIMAALNAKGTSSVSRIYHLDRGYERIEEKLSQLGAKIIRVRE
jgi:UDP-N-acetylglucosamine 1-carboxyvinyltransferase